MASTNYRAVYLVRQEFYFGISLRRHSEIAKMLAANYVNR